MVTIKNIYSLISNKTMYIILYIIFFMLSCSDALELDDPCQILDPSNVKEGVTYIDCEGNSKVGTMLVQTTTTTEVNEKSYSLCTASNQQDCIINSDFRSIKTSDIDPNNLKTGFSILNVEGNIPVCASDNESGCITTSRFKSVDINSIPYSGLLSSVSIFGTEGGLTNCTTGGYNCYINTDSFKAAESSLLLASNIKTGMSIGGVNGSYEVVDCDGSSHTGCVAVEEYPSVPSATVSTYLRQGSGQGITGSIGVCDGDTSKSNCYVNEEDPTIFAIDTTNITAGNIKSGVIINNITGTYPQVSGVNESKASLTASAFSNMGSLTYPAGTDFVWFDSEGVESTGKVSVSLDTKNVKKSVSVFGITGSYVGISPRVYVNDFFGEAFAILNTNGSVISGGTQVDETGARQRYYNGVEYVDVSPHLKSGVKEIYHNSAAFAALKNDGSVVTWGDDYCGANSSTPVGGDLSSGVIKISSTECAFAALKEDGSVVTWGSKYSGGNFNYSDGSTTMAPTGTLSAGVREIYSSSSAFAALKNDGSVVTWGNSSNGGNSTSATGGSLSSGVVKVFSSRNAFGGAFAALKSNGSVVTWGNADFGGSFTDDSAGLIGVSAASLSSDVINIVSTVNAESGGAFAALKSGGSVITWGSSSYGADSSSTTGGDISSGVEKIYANSCAFAAVKTDGSVVTWGDIYFGGNFNYFASGYTSDAPVGSLSSGVVSIYSTSKAFAAVKTDGSVVTWGSYYSGGDSSETIGGSLTSGVIKVVSNGVGTFAALKEDGTVVTWGGSEFYGKDPSHYIDHNGSTSLTNIIDIKGGTYFFIAIREDGTYITWGAYDDT